VLSHEMAHVIARHAAIREDQVRQAMIVSRVISDVVSDPDLGALALAKSKISLASFSRGQELEADAVGVGISARASYDAFENTWFNVESTVRGLSGGSYRAIEDAMRTLRDALYQGAADPARARNALADLRGQVAAFGAPYGASAATASAAGAASMPAQAAQAPLPTAAVTSTAAGTSTGSLADPGFFTFIASRSGREVVEAVLFGGDEQGALGEHGLAEDAG